MWRPSEPDDDECIWPQSAVHIPGANANRKNCSFVPRPGLASNDLSREDDPRQSPRRKMMPIQALDSRRHTRDQADDTAYRFSPATPRLTDVTAALAFFGKDQLRDLEDEVVQQKGRLAQAG
jgi:hypothetical protein